MLLPERVSSPRPEGSGDINPFSSGRKGQLSENFSMWELTAVHSRHADGPSIEKRLSKPHVFRVRWLGKALSDRRQAAR